MRKLTKRQAQRLFDKGEAIYLKPSKISEQAMQYSPWFHWCKIHKNANDGYEEEATFEQAINAFWYNNCSNEVGLRVHYYSY